MKYDLSKPILLGGREVDMRRWQDVDQEYIHWIFGYIQTEEFRIRFEFLCELEMPALIAIAKIAVEDFSSIIKRTRVRQFTGVVIAQYARAAGYNPNGSRAIPSKFRPFSKGLYFV